MVDIYKHMMEFNPSSDKINLNGEAGVFPGEKNLM